MDLDQDVLEAYDAAKEGLKEIYDLRGKEAIFRSKTKWIEEGEKSTKYFFNLEKRNYEKKTIILQVKLENGQKTSDLKKENKEIERFFSNMFTATLADIPLVQQKSSFNNFVEGLELPKLMYEEQVSLEHELSLEEIKKNNKSPGEDGFTVEFYETFFDILQDDLLNSYNEAFQKGKLSVSQRRGILSLIPKEDNDLSELTSWRPITLLNVDYKILAKTIAKRIEQFLPKLIHSDQTGFIKDRYIGQNVRLLSDLMEYTDAKKISGVFLFVDFEKAFDSIEWSFINNTLALFNFGASIRKWFSVLYNSVETAIMNAGYKTNNFKISRGVRQGCPLSQFLFILAVELLATKFASYKTVKVYLSLIIKR